MNNKHSLKYMDFFLIIIIFAAITSQYLIGPNRFITTFLRSTSVAGMVFYAGYLSSAYHKNRTVFFHKTAFFASLFFLIGLIYQISEGFSLFDSFINMATFRSIPRYSDLFFTFTLLFFACAFISQFTPIIIRHSLVFSLISLMLSGLVFLPQDIIGYPLLGAFFGCNTYRCIALLPYSIFYIFGIFTENKQILLRKYLLPITFIITVCSVLLRSSSMKLLAQIGFAAFPIFLLVYFLQYSRLAEYTINLAKCTKAAFIRLIKSFSNTFKTGGKKNLLLYTFIYSIFFFTIAFFTFSLFRENSLSFVSVKDAIAQYIPRAHYFTNFIQQNFSLSFFDFNIGLGRAVILDFEPLYWLYALFDANNIETTYAFIIIIRMFFAGLAISLMFFYFKRNYYEMLFGSIMYTFCGYALYQCTRNGQFISPMILLPLFIIAMEEIIRNKRWYLCTIVVTLSLLSTYYFLYINTIAMGIYYVARFLLSKNPSIKNWKYFFQRSFTLAGSYILGVCMGSIALFPAMSSYLGSSRSGDIAIPTDSFLFYSRSWLVKCYMSFISLPNSIGYALKLGFIPLAYIAVVILFLKKENKLLKWMFAISSSFCIFPVFAYILSGFNTITHRWSYIYALIVTVITVYTLPTLRTLSKRELKIIFISLIPYGIILLFDTDFRSASTLAAFGILLANYIFIIFMNENFDFIRKRCAETGLLVLCISSILLNSYYQYSEGHETTPNWYVPSGDTLQTVSDTPLSALTDLDDDSFYRVSTSDVSYKTLSSSIVMDYNGIADFSSVMIGSISDYNSEMGNSEHNLVHLDGFDNRTAMNALACVKYHSLEQDEKGVVPYGYTLSDRKEVNGKTYHIYENQYALPLGYTYDSTITEDELKNYTELEKQQILLQAACTDTSAPIAHAEEPVTNYTESEITNIEADGVTFSDDTLVITKPDASITFTFDGTENSETYLEFRGSYDPSTDSSETSTSVTMLTENAARYYMLYPDTNTYNTNQDTLLYNLGYNKDKLQQCTVIFKGNTSVTSETPDVIHVDSFGIYTQTMEDYGNKIEALKENVLEDVSLSSNKITGNIKLTKDKYFVLSIPYQNGWTAYVDGKETNIEKANSMYMGFPLSAGEHSIELYYERPGVKLSLIVTIIGFVAFVTALIIRRYRIKMKKENKINRR